MPKLNRNLPYSENIGHTGPQVYSQDGIDFDANGNELDADGKIVDDGSEHPPIEPTQPDFTISLEPIGKPRLDETNDQRIDEEEDIGDQPVIYNSEDPHNDGVEFHKLPAAHLKELVEAHGADYTNKRNAVAFLNEKQEQKYANGNPTPAKAAEDVAPPAEEHHEDEHFGE